MRHAGTLLHWDDAKGFGRVTPVGNGQPVFVHIRDFERRGRRPARGDAISFEFGCDAKGRACATKVCFADQKAGVTIRVSPLPLLGAMAFLLALSGFAFVGWLPWLIPAAVLGLSLFTFLIYAADKSAAARSARRTPEKNLHTLALLGGWPGAIFAQQLLRHKSVKREFLAVFRVTVVLNIATLGWLVSPYGEPVRTLIGHWV